MNDVYCYSLQFTTIYRLFFNLGVESFNTEIYKDIPSGDPKTRTKGNIFGSRKDVSLSCYS